MEKWKIGILIGGILRLTIPAARHHTCVRLPFGAKNMLIPGYGTAHLSPIITPNAQSVKVNFPIKVVN
jgi:hypothetical protein